MFLQFARPLFSARIRQLPACLCFALWAQIAVLGMAVQDGADGQPGDPGNDGQDGTTQSQVDHQIQSKNEFLIETEFGGDGGDGGTGVDGPDPDQSAAGGQGGQGGDGAALHVWNAEEEADRVRGAIALRSGSGGDGGSGGRSMGVPDSQGNSGGNGGMITTDLFVNRSFVVHGLGGSGGDALGYQNVAGRGADVHLNVSLTDSPFQAVDKGISIQQYIGAGAGGFGRATADGGAGGNAIYAHESPLHVTSGSPFFRYQFDSGRGGDSLGGNSGNGGDILWTNRETYIGGTSSPSLARYVMHWTGGNGGNSFLLNGQSRKAGDGGDVQLNHEANQTIYAQGGQFQWQAQVYGGNGGYSNAHGDAGHGGDVNLDYLRVSTQGDVPAANQSYRQNLYTRGGDGGYSQGGAGGNGGKSHSYVDEFCIDTAGSVQMLHVATGGDGGRGVAGGNGGSAWIKLSEPLINSNAKTTEESGRPQGPVDIELRAFGGYGGNEAWGGSANVEVFARGNDDVHLRGLARAGQSVDGRASLAYGMMNAWSSGDENSVATSALTVGMRYDRGEPSKIGGSAIGAAIASVDQGRLARAEVNAIAGYGTEGTGESRALAATYVGSEGGLGISNATAVSQQVGPSVELYLQRSYASAEVTAHQGRGQATSHATAYGVHSLAAADTSMQVLSGTSTATAVSLAPAYNYQSQVITRSEVSSPDQFDYFSSGSEIYYKRLTPFGNPISQATTTLFVSSGLESASGSDGFGSGFDLTDETNDVFNVTKTRFGNSNIETELYVEQEIEAWETDHSLSVVFFDTDWSGASMGSLDLFLSINDEILLDESWTDLAAAEMDLDKLIIDWDQELVAGELLRTEMRYRYETPEDYASFRLGIAVVGFAKNGDGAANFTAVPEPGSAWALLGLGSLLVLRRKRSATCQR